MSERGGRRAGEARAEEGVEAQREGSGGVGEEASEEEGDAGGWAHVEVSAAGHVPFVQRLVEGGGAVEEALRRERESREA